MALEFKSIPYWVRPLLWFVPELVAGAVGDGRFTVVHSKKLFGRLYILKIETTKNDCRYCGY